MTSTNSTSLAARAHDGEVTDDTDPAARPTRRTFTAEQKLAILTAYEEATESGAKGALLRREGIYSSQITEWRKARDAGSLDALGAKARGSRSAEAKEADRLRKKNERLEAELAKTRTALDIVGKAHALLEMLSESADTDEK
jgi:transposase-like protein